MQYEKTTILTGSTLLVLPGDRFVDVAFPEEPCEMPVMGKSDQEVFASYVCFRYPSDSCEHNCSCSCAFVKYGYHDPDDPWASVTLTAVLCDSAELYLRTPTGDECVRLTREGTGDGGPAEWTVSRSSELLTCEIEGGAHLPCASSNDETWNYSGGDESWQEWTNGEGGFLTFNVGEDLELGGYWSLFPTLESGVIYYYPAAADALELKFDNGYRFVRTEPGTGPWTMRIDCVDIQEAKACYRLDRDPDGVALYMSGIVPYDGEIEDGVFYGQMATRSAVSLVGPKFRSASAPASASMSSPSGRCAFAICCNEDADYVRMRNNLVSELRWYAPGVDVVSVDIEEAKDVLSGLGLRDRDFFFFVRFAIPLMKQFRGYDRVIWADVDIDVVSGMFAGVISEETSADGLAAVRDTGWHAANVERMRRLFPWYDRSTYFNSGLCVMDLRKIDVGEWRRRLEEGAALFRTKRFDYPDQDWFNAYFEIREIDMAYNRFACCQEDPQYAVHYVGRYKRDLLEALDRRDAERSVVDAVFVIGTGSRHGNEELKYALRNLDAHCKFVRNVYICGECPAWVDRSAVKYLPWPDRFKHAKDANIIDKLRHACRAPGIAKNVLFCSDDQFQTRGCSWDDFAPRYLRRYSSADTWYADRHRVWHTRLRDTLEREVERRKAMGMDPGDVYYWQPHIWMPIDRDVFLDYAAWSDYEHRSDTIIASGYFNFADAVPRQNFDHAFISAGTRSLPNVTHIAYSDGQYDAAMASLRDMFQRPCRFEAGGDLVKVSFAKRMRGEDADAGSKDRCAFAVYASGDRFELYKANIMPQLSRLCPGIDVVEVDIAEAEAVIGKLAEKDKPAFARLAIPLIAQFSAYDKVAWVDCDAEVVDGRFADIFKCDTSDDGLAAVPDKWQRHCIDSLRRRVADWNGDKYYNSGVLLMDLKKVDRSQWRRRVADGIDDHLRQRFGLWDQDLLNLYFDIAPIDAKFNVMLDHGAFPHEGWYMHYTGAGGHRMLDEILSAKDGAAKESAADGCRTWVQGHDRIEERCIVVSPRHEFIRPWIRAYFASGNTIPLVLIPGPEGDWRDGDREYCQAAVDFCGGMILDCGQEWKDSMARLAGRSARRSRIGWYSKKALLWAVATRLSPKSWAWIDDDAEVTGTLDECFDFAEKAPGFISAQFYYPGKDARHPRKFYTWGISSGRKLCWNSLVFFHGDANERIAEQLCKDFPVEDDEIIFCHLYDNDPAWHDGFCDFSCSNWQKICSAVRGIPSEWSGKVLHYASWKGNGEVKRYWAEKADKLPLAPFEAGGRALVKPVFAKMLLER